MKQSKKRNQFLYSPSVLTLSHCLQVASPDTLQIYVQKRRNCSRN